MAGLAGVRELQSRLAHGRYWILVTVFALGVASIGMLLATNWIRE